MPDTTLSQAIQEAYASAPVDEIIYHTLEITHPDPAFPNLYVVHGFDAITTGVPAVSWIPIPFELTLPEVSANGPPQLQIKLDNVSAVLTKAMDAAADSGEPVSIIYRAYLKSDLSKPQNNPPFVLSLLTVEATPYTVTATAALSDFGNRKWPRRIYRDNEFPGLAF